MAVFTGTEPARIDTQGRLGLPRAFREGLRSEAGGQIHWLPLADGGLILLPSEIEARARQIESLHAGAGAGDDGLVAELEEAFGAVATLHMDVQARVRLPDEGLAGLGTEVVVIGLGPRLRVRPAAARPAGRKGG